MDDLRGRIKKTNQKIAREGKKEIKKQNTLEKDVSRELKKNILTRKGLEIISAIREFIKKYKK